MALAKSQRSLKAWGKQKWRTKSGKPSTQGSKATGERYLPEKAIKALSASEYAASSAAKRKARSKSKRQKQTDSLKLQRLKLVLLLQKRLQQVKLHGKVKWQMLQWILGKTSLR
jgi:hypothetical protein